MVSSVFLTFLAVLEIRWYVFHVRNGSTIADVILSFAISPEVSVVPDDELVKTFKEVVENGSVEETKQFDIDTEKLYFKGEIINVHPNN
jgi:hypothetical protein